MPFFSNRRLAGFALCLAALAFPTVLRAQIKVDYGDITSSLDYKVGLQYRATINLYGGCLNGSEKYYVDVMPGNRRFELTGTGPSRQRTVSYELYEDQVTGPFNDQPREVLGNGVFYFTLLNKNLQPVDSDTIQLELRANVTYEAGSGEWRYEKAITLRPTLKPGGPSPGKIRLPQDALQGEDPPEPEEQQEIDIFSDNSDYYIEPGTGRVMPNTIPSYDLGGHQGQFPKGAGWMTVSVPPSSVGGGAVPPGLSAAYPNAGSIGTSPSGNPAYMGSNRKSGGQNLPAFTGGSVTVGADGTTHVNAWGAGSGTDMHLAFPPGYEPIKKDPASDPNAEEPPNLLDTDPCFAFAAELEGLPAPGTGPGGPGLPPGMTPGGAVPLPPGMTPGGGLPLPPEFTPIGGGDPPASPNPGTPSSGGGAGGGGGLIGGGGGSGPITGPDPEPPGPDPDPDPDPDPSGPELPTGPAGGPLPDVGAAESEADSMARRLSERVGQIEERAKRFMNWGQITPFSTGDDGPWQVTIPIGGQSHAMTIPTQHAPLVRGLLLLMITGLFISAVFKLLLS